MDTVRESARPGRAAPMSADDRRQAIIDAVLPLLVKHGEAVSTRQIAEAAGIAEGTIFRVFPDKNALLMAAAAHTLNPPNAGQELADAVAGLDDLHELVRVVAERMLVRSEQVMAVMISLRSVWHAAHEEPRRRDAGAASAHAGPPAFVLEAHQALLERLTAVFEPQRERLRVSPERAALLLRTLVLGTRNPGVRPEDRLSAEDIAEALLHGICRTEGD
ncbi:MAG: TetR/AcrR family transcriptional regulator [Nocardioides sp.]